MRRILAALFAGLAIIGAAGAGERLPLFDAHLHYNWEPKPFYAIDEVLRTGEPSVITGSVVLAGQAVVAAGRQL